VRGTERIDDGELPKLGTKNLYTKKLNKFKEYELRDNN
jgi:hypothetical protein